MTAQLIQFPKAKKRGAKVRKGPLCDFHEIAPQQRPRVVGADDAAVNRFAEKLKQVIDDPDSSLGQMIRERWAEQERVARLRFEQWQQGTLMAPRDFAAAARYGCATDHFGEGPDAFRWAVAEARNRAVEAQGRDQALRLAIDCLNAVAHAVRYGGLRAESSTLVREGHDGEAAAAYCQGVLSTIGHTVASLRAFGAGADPA